MPTLETVRLTFPGGLHPGTRGVNLEESGLSIPSDTLFAALVDAYRRDGGDPEEWIQPFPRAHLSGAGATAADDGWDHATGDPPFLLGSAFPYVGHVRFFPVPAPHQRVFDDTTLKERRKDINSIRFVSEGILRRALTGEKLDEWLFPPGRCAEPTNGVALQEGACWLLREECDRLPETVRDAGGRRSPLRALRQRRVYATTRVPRVTVSRISSAAQIFHAGRVHFAPDCGLWFGLQWRVPEMTVGGSTYRTITERLLSVLGDDGLGGERTTGYGGFTWQPGESLSLPDPADGDLMLLLSRYHPRSVELPAALAEALAYALTPVGGWLRPIGAAARRRRRLWLVSEGSVIRALGNPPQGDVVDARPVYRDENAAKTTLFDHPVWRYGLALGVRFQEARHG